MARTGSARPTSSTWTTASTVVPSPAAPSRAAPSRYAPRYAKRPRWRERDRPATLFPTAALGALRSLHRSGVIASRPA